jgi:uncharacterized integral membrane protein (TIGR00698 family)
MTVVGVTALSTIAMIVYPLLTAALGLDSHSTGVFLGATIHDVAQVVGAGYSISNDAGDTATIVKLFRVALLLPAVFAISVLFRSGHAAGADRARPPLLPMFLAGFAALVVVNSTGWVPQPVSAGLQEVSRWSLVIAIAALGTKTSLGDLAQVGWRPIAVLVGETLVVAVLVLAGLLLMGRI